MCDSTPQRIIWPAGPEPDLLRCLCRWTGPAYSVGRKADRATSMVMAKLATYLKWLAARSAWRRDGRNGCSFTHVKSKDRSKIVSANQSSRWRYPTGARRTDWIFPTSSTPTTMDGPIGPCNHKPRHASLRLRKFPAWLVQAD
jgi:hypothetical protein